MSVAAVDHEHRVTPRELFFDLVFVFAFTQVATLLADDPTFAGIGRGVLVLAALWWAWAAYAWLTNIVDPEEGVVGAALLVALIAMFIAALAVPSAFGDPHVDAGLDFGEQHQVVGNPRESRRVRQEAHGLPAEHGHSPGIPLPRLQVRIRDS